MEIQKTPAIVKLPSDFQNLPKHLAMLQVGAALNAVVSDKLAENSYLIKLADGMQIRAQTLQALQPGQALLLEVVKTGAVPELKIVLPEHPTQPGQKAVQQALRKFLPQQQSLTALVGVLRQFATSSSEKTDGVSATVQNLLASIPANADLMSADPLKQTIGNSGVFLEAKLANHLPTQGDIKAMLLNLEEALQKPHTSSSALANNESTKKMAPEPTNANPTTMSGTLDAKESGQSLLKATESAIARIVLDQISALPQDNEAQQLWQIELPYTDGAHIDAVKLKIKREGNAQTETRQTNWSVTLEINPPGMGILHSKISLVNDKVDTYFWSDRQNTAADVEKNLGMLADRFSQAGLTVGNLNVFDGAPIDTKSSGTPFQQPLLDEFL